MAELPIIQTNAPPGMIDLGVGHPDLSLLPLELIQYSAEKFFIRNDPRSLQYGAEQGDGFFRDALANFLTSACNYPVDANRLFITNGASSALDLICTVYTHPGDTIFVEEPSYFLALRIFEDHGLQVVSIPMDAGGLNIDALEEKLADVLPRFIYTIPTFQNPTGRTLSLPRREKLIKLAQQHNFMVIADEVYHLLHYNQPLPKPLAMFSEDVEQVISVNSFSKILAPGLRLGWIQAHERVIEQLAGSGLLFSGGGMNPITSALVRDLIVSGGLEGNINRLRQAYSSRLDALDAALTQYLPEAIYDRPEGGFFIWVQLPGVDMTELRYVLRESDVDLRQGVLFSSQNKLQDFMRLSFCYYPPAEIEEGIRRVGHCLH